MRNPDRFYQKAQEAVNKHGAMPEGLESYIRQLVSDMLRLCDDPICTSIGEEQVNVLLKRIESAIKKKRDDEIQRVLSEIRQDLIKKEDIEVCVRGIWNSETIASGVISLLKNIKLQKRRELTKRWSGEY